LLRASPMHEKGAMVVQTEQRGDQWSPLGDPARRTSIEQRRPAAKNAVVSAQMSRMPRSSTGPELTLRRHLHAAGLRFRLHVRQLPGRPDIVLTRARVAIFIDGCFWHGCPTHGVLPKHNRDWWVRKLQGNKERDLRNDARLVEAGWLPVHVWEHEPVGEAVSRIVDLWRERTGRWAVD
jgi:DNA mismatch endonuclease, patch repair protein